MQLGILYAYFTARLCSLEIIIIIHFYKLRYSTILQYHYTKLRMTSLCIVAAGTIPLYKINDQL